jgi:prephenate dehydrogenase
VSTLSDPATGSSGAVAVCGGGLVGTSIALALAGRGLAVRVADRDETVRRDLAARVAADGLDARVTVHADWTEAATGAALVVAAVPPSAVVDVLRVAAEVAADDAVLTDVASVKAGLVADVCTALASKVGAAARYVGGHPMAGSERSGPDAADPQLFQGATWVLTPTSATDDRSVAVISELVRSLGGRVLVLEAATHDVIVGLVSHLPQLVASVLADVAAEALGPQRDAVLAVAGPGFRDTTRIAASDPTLWLDILDGNRVAVLDALSAFRGRLDVVAEAVAAQDRDTLRDVLTRASEARRRFVPKAVDDATVHLVVPLRDRPGEIARIAGGLGSAGINIEDLAMRHATAADRGALIVRIRHASVERAVDALLAVDVEGVVVERDPEGDPDREALREALCDGTRTADA